MKRFLIFVSAHLFLFLLVIAYQAQADDEEWNINKYCHVSAYIAYDNCSPVYKQTFKFELNPSTHNSIIWEKIIKILKKNGINVELKS